MDSSTNAGSPGAPLSIVVDDGLAGVLELRATGVILLPELRDAHRQLAQLRARRNDLRCLLFDAEAVTRFGRGAVVEAARWVTRNAQHFDLAITVTRSPSMKSAALALAACAPRMRHVVVSEREQAMTMLRERTLAMTG
jgi:hypothetical protein